MASEFKGRIVVFSIPTCRYCKQSKAILNSFSVPFHDVNLEKHPERRAESQERTGRRTVPQIFFNDVHIGGFDELKKLVCTARGKFCCFRGTLRTVLVQVPSQSV